MKILPVLILFAFAACSKPLVKQMEQNYAESRKEAFTAVSAENTASFEAMKADSVVIVKYDTVTQEKISVKYYGIEKIKTDTISVVNTVLQTKTDTVYRKEKVLEKNEKSFFAKTENILKLLIALTVIIYILWRLRK